MPLFCEFCGEECEELFTLEIDRYFYMAVCKTCFYVYAQRQPYPSELLESNLQTTLDLDGDGKFKSKRKDQKDQIEIDIKLTTFQLDKSRKKNSFKRKEKLLRKIKKTVTRYESNHSIIV